MALLFLESFDGYGGDRSHMTEWATAPFMTAVSPPGRTGSHCQWGGFGGDAVRNLTPATSTVIIGFAFYWVGNTGWISLGDSAGGSNRQCQMNMQNTGKLAFYRGWGGTLLEETASAVLTLNAWNSIEAKIAVGNSGTWTVKCNGVTVLNGSGDTQEQATSAIGSLRIAPSGTSDNSGIDDLWMLDSSGAALNDFLGDCRIECLLPQTGNGANTGLTPSTGTDHGALVDELPADDDTTYNAGSTAGVKDTYAFTNLTISGTPVAVQLNARATKSDVAAKQLALVARLGSTDYDGTTQSVIGTTYIQYQQRWPTRPSDGGAWTISDVNAAEFGLKVVS